MNLRSLHENLFREAEMTIPSSKKPIIPKREQKPVTPMNRWVKSGSSDCASISKTFSFINLSDRNAFIRELLEYEEVSSHSARITTIEGFKVVVTLTTQNIGVSDLDKDYARYADDVFSDVSFLTSVQ